MKSDLSLKKSWILVLTLISVQLVGIFLADVKLTDPPMDDAPAYQIFIEDFLKGKLNFSQGGFQGSALPAIILHSLLPTSQSFALTQHFFALASIAMVFVVSKQFFDRNIEALVATLLWALIPEIMFAGFNGYPQGVFHFASVLTIYLVYRNPKWSGFSWGWAMISKPFAAALLPFFLIKRQYKQILISLVVGILYLFIQHQSLGRLMIGVHPNITVNSVFQPARILYNLASAPPLLFSIHNYLPFSAKTTLGDRVHISPLTTVAAMIAVLYLGKRFKSRKIFQSLVWFAGLAFLLPISLSYLDTNYLQTFLLAIIWLSVPFYTTYPRLLPITVATIFYQYLFILLSNPNTWPASVSWALYSIPLVGLVISLGLANHMSRN